MKKHLLLLIIPLLFFTANSTAQIKYWDFGAKDLPGYTNVMPLSYLNAFADYTRDIDWTDNLGGIHIANPFNETGQSMESAYFLTFEAKYANYLTSGFQISSKSSSPVGGTYLSGNSAYTKPDLLPDLDGTTDLTFQKDSNSDRIYTVNKTVTRFDERDLMYDNMDPDLFPGCLRFTSPGEKRWNRSGGRGFLLNLDAGQWITIVGSGQYTDIEGDAPIYSLGAITGYIKFEYLGAGQVVNIDDFGAGKGAFDGSGFSGGDRGDETVRVMQFQALDAGPYKIANRGGTIIVYRIYLGQVDASLGAGLTTKIYVNGVYSKTLGLEAKTSPVQTNVQAIGNRIYVSNVKSSTEVKIYAITGALVKEFKTNNDMDFAFKAGLYIATVKTAEGQKSVKLLLN